LAEDAIELTVVIPAYNAAATLGEQLNALSAQAFSGAWEVVVADNGSTDATAALIAAHAQRMAHLRRVDASSRRGVNAARNAGLRAARGRLILFCDADDVAAPGYVAAMARALARADGAAARLSFTRLNPHLQHRPETSGLSWEGCTPVPVGAASGWRRSLLEALGGFDPAFTNGCDDIEFALRAARRGARVVEAPGALLHKRERAEPGAVWRQYFRYGQARPQLVRAFPGAAVRRSTLCASGHWARNAWELLRHGPSDHAALKQLAKNAGRLAGSLQHRCWAP
jgi:glycosyltransferase involved in cell wall biosynthesis